MRFTYNFFALLSSTCLITSCGPSSDVVSISETEGDETSNETDGTADLDTTSGVDGTTSTSASMDASDSSSGGVTDGLPMCGDGKLLAGEVCFGSPQTANTPFPPLALLAADLDGDGLPEVLMGSALGRVDVWSSTGRMLVPHASFQLVDRTSALVADDIDGDGALDVVASISGLTGNDGVQVLFNDGQGMLQPTDMLETGAQALRLALADFNHDGVADLVLPDWQGGTVQLWEGDGDGGFVWMSQQPVGQRPRDVTITDLDADGNPDIVVALENCFGGWMDPNGYCENAEIVVLKGNGDTTLSPPVFYEFDAYHGHRVLVAEIDARSGLDVLAIPRHCYSGPEPYCIAPARVALFNVDVSGALGVPSYAESDRAHIEARGGALADVDGDGMLDAIFLTNREVGRGYAGQVAILRASAEPELVEVAAGPYAFDVVATDVDGDGFIDVIISNTPESSITLLLGDP